MTNQLAQQIYLNNVKKGFYEEEKNIGEMLALIHSEVSEALEAHRKGISIPEHYSVKEAFEKPRTDEAFKEWFKEDIKDSFEDEIADSVIRLLDLCGYLKIDIETHIKAKMKYNELRPYKHGKKY